MRLLDKESTNANLRGYVYHHQQVARAIPKVKFPAILLLALILPPSISAADPAQAVANQVLELVNAARAIKRRCGWKRFSPSAPLVTSDALQRAALSHAEDLAARRKLSHSGEDGSTPGERATRAGYKWRIVGENIAAGQSTAELVVADWLESPQHCANLMSPDYSEMGVAFADAPQSEMAIYWVQVFATPQPAP